nr:PKD domain-containing protein [Bacteroidota bacterium]
MKQCLMIWFIGMTLIINGQCTWTLGVTSQNNSFTLTCLDTTLNMQAVNNCTSPVSFFWNGPGTSASTQSVSVSAPGMYSLSVTDVNACVNTVTFAVTINTVVPVFTLNPLAYTVTCQNNAPTFTATAISPTNNITWSWYNPNNPPPGPPSFMSNNVNALFSAAMPGGHTVQLENLSSGCKASMTFTVFDISGFPTFSVAAANNFQLGCWPADTLYITNVALTNANASASYSFMAPGSNGAFPIPGGMPLSPSSSFVAQFPGSYTVIVQDDLNFCQTAVGVNVISSSVSIAFSNTVNSNGVVNFSSTSLGTNITTSYLWDYGDGTSGTGVTSSHTYSNGGTHYVTLQTLNPSCTSASGSVNVNTIPCLANSSFSLTYSGTPQFWYAVPDYYGNVINSIWSWGDGTSTNALFPSHTYSSPGIYNICLTVTVSCLNSSGTCANYNIYKLSAEQQMVNVTVVKSLPVGVKELESQQDLIQLFPSPANDYLFVQGIQSGYIELYNNYGEVILTQNISDKCRVSLSSISSGIYFARILSAKE